MCWHSCYCDVYIIYSCRYAPINWNIIASIQLFKNVTGAKFYIRWSIICWCKRNNSLSQLITSPLNRVNLKIMVRINRNLKEIFFVLRNEWHKVMGTILVENGDPLEWYRLFRNKRNTFICKTSVRVLFMQRVSTLSVMTVIVNNAIVPDIQLEKCSAIRGL